MGIGENKEMKDRTGEGRKAAVKIELLSPLTGDFFPNEPEYDELDSEYSDPLEGETMSGEELAQYERSIREMVEADRPDNLMEYFYGSDELKEKVESAVVSVKNVDGVLYGCTALGIRESLDEKELSEMKEYIQGQYSDGWGEGFEQREFPVDDGTLQVHFWQPGGFRFLCEAEICIHKSAKETFSRPKMKLLGQNGNVFSIMGTARNLLQQNGQRQQADEMFDRVLKANSYENALGIISEYVETELSRPMHEKEPKAQKRNEKAGDSVR